MFKRLTQIITRRTWWVLLAGFLFLGAAGFVGTGVFDKLSQGGFENENSESTQVLREVDSRFGSENSLIVLLADKQGLPATDPIVEEAARTTLAVLAGQAGVEGVTTYYDAHAPPLLSRDGLQTYAVVSLAGDEEQQTDTVERLRPLLASDRLSVKLGGGAAAGDELNTQIDKDLKFAEMVSFPILAVLLLIVFRNLLSALLPLMIGVLSILGAFLILHGLTTVMDISIYSINIITLLGLGLAIDYSLFMVSRFREELRGNRGNAKRAIAATMKTAGRTVFFSGVTVMVSLLALLVFPLNFLQSMGLGGAAAVLVAMAAALTVLPAVMLKLGERLVPRRQRKRPASKVVRHGAWYRVSRFVMRYPVTVLVVTTGLLLLAGTPFLRAEFSTADAKNLPKGADARVVDETLERDFPNPSTDPIQILVTTKGSPLEPKNLDGLYEYARQLQRLQGVEHVDSLISNNPNLPKQAHLDFYAHDRLAEPAVQQIVGTYVGEGATILKVHYASAPMAGESRDLVRAIRDLPAFGLDAKVGGTSAQLVDLLDTLQKYAPYALLIIFGAMFVLLFLMLGSVIVPIKAMILNVLSLSASFGALVLVFQEGFLTDLIPLNSIGSIDATQPVLIFAIAFGLSMDYAVFLLSRIKEQRDKRVSNEESISSGVEKTGAIITSAAILLVVVIGAFATGKISLMQQIGVGLGLAILIDAVIVRMFMVPAAMKLLGSANWYAPPGLKKLYSKLKLGE